MRWFRRAAPAAEGATQPPADDSPDGTTIAVTAEPGAARGHLTWANGQAACALGRTGISHDKKEGDGATPAGVLPLVHVFYRADRLDQPATMLSCGPLNPADGWCDDPGHPRYNRLVRLPFPAGHERLWRDDGLYDVIVVLGYNDDPVAPDAGSAIFLHVAAPGLAPTEGCVALPLDDLLALLGDCAPGDALRISAR